VIDEVIAADNTVGKGLDLLNGEVAISEAIARL
jgi:hypothetical protein